MQRKRSINAEPDLNIDLMQFKLDFLYRSNSHCIWFVSFVISLSCLVLIMRTILATNDFLAFLFCLKQRCLFSFSLTTKLKETSLFLIKQHFKAVLFFLNLNILTYDILARKDVLVNWRCYWRGLSVFPKFQFCP